MRVEEIRTERVAKPYPQNMWLSIWKPHEYTPQNDREFCAFCKHSKKWHIENEDWCEPDRYLNEKE